MHSNQYTLIFTSVLTIILASLLSVAAGSLNQIQKLNELYKDGSLTKDEFEKAKKKILN